MWGKAHVSRETVRSVAECWGLTTDEAHLEELLQYVNEHLPNLSALYETDLSEIEPALTSVPDKES